MSKLSELIKSRCPNGVKHKPLSEVAQYSKLRVPASEMSAETYVGVDNLLPEKQGKKLSDYVPGSGMLTGYVVGDVLIGNIRPYLKKVWLANCDGGANGDVLVVHLITEDLTPEFLYYLLSADTFFAYDMQNAKGAKMPRGDKDSIMQSKIPVPPMQVQREIVKILDNFTELTAELTARKKQYEYYRNSLLSYEGETSTLGAECDTVTDYVAAGSFADLRAKVEYKSVPDYAQLVRTTDIKNNFAKRDLVYVTESAFKFLWRVNLDTEAIILPNIGVNCGEVYYLAPDSLPYENNVLGPNAILVRSSKHNNKYLSYLFQTPLFQKQLKIIISPGGQTKFNKTELKKLQFSLPSRKEQDRIVALLDKFDTLTSDLTAGLPAEIAARQKQYEYYRDKLLAFKEIA